MFLETNSIWIMFDGVKEELQKLDGFIKQYIESKAEKNPDEYRFLQHYRPKTYEIHGRPMRSDNFDVLTDFCKKLVKELPEIGFSGMAKHLSDDDNVEASYFHLAGPRKLHWKKYTRFFDEVLWRDSGYSEGGIWDAITGETEERMPRHVASFFFDAVPALDTTEFPVVAPVDPGKELDNTKRIEQLNIGDQLHYQVDWESKNDMPALLELLNANNEPLGLLQADPTVLALMAEDVQDFTVTVEKVVPVAMKRKNAKYASLDVSITSAKRQSLSTRAKIVRWGKK